MNDVSLKLDPAKESEDIVRFLKDTFHKTGKTKAVIGWSGGIDSTVSLFLLFRALSPANIHVIHMPYKISFMNEFGEIQKKLRLPSDNITEHSIKHIVDTISTEEQIGDTELDRIRLGNIMARTRMILLFDRARALDGLVCGTENKSEHLLGYFTRYGDAASDIEPITGLYKTQVYALARFLEVPETFIRKAPSAGLWGGQTDEGEFGFTYEEADHVCRLYFDMHEPVAMIEKKGYPNAGKIIGYAEKNSFKQTAPYVKT